MAAGVLPLPCAAAAPHLEARGYVLASPNDHGQTACGASGLTHGGEQVGNGFPWLRVPTKVTAVTIV